jgi:predicted polyphosphate/ATP-dependent NAD kinase
MRELDRFAMARASAPRKIGLIVNPIAGMGGSVALKGTDGAEILAEARSRGAEPAAQSRAIRALKKLAAAGADIELHAPAGIMGGEAARAAGLAPRLLALDVGLVTTASDTTSAAQALARLNVDVILFAGGDGTARDILAAVGDHIPMLGIPSGVKMHSAVFAVSPEAAGQLAALIAGDDGGRIAWREAEVMDVDEVALRAGHLSAALFGYARVPVERHLVQGPKAAALSDEAAIEGVTAEIARAMEPGTLYLLGPGTSTKRLLRHLSLEGTLLGVDAVRDGKLMGRDLTAGELIKATAGMPAKIVVSVVGGQGHVFGRGNQQFSPALIRRIGRDNVIVIATQAKLLALAANRLLVDTGEADLDRALAGFIRVRIGPSRSTLMRIA